MTNKNLEKLAEIGERKLLDDLTNNLLEIKQRLMGIQENGNSHILKSQYIENKIKSYENLITTCKSYGVDVNEQEKIYGQIIYNAKEYLGQKEIQSLSRLSVRTQHGNEMEEFIN
ncbi:MAG: hypothetical protein Q8O84_05095 [Nanoarchaeota archaeon]|nr:hypothetical protein [Nanoarchaeota archaeon]